MDFTPVDSANEERTIEILAECFADDPVMNWSCNHPSTLVPFFEITLEPFLQHNLSYLDKEERGAAVWLGPNQKLQWSYRPSNVWKMLSLGGMKGVYRMARSGMVTEKYHPSEPHYYLFAIGALPSARGQGVGSSLISHVLRRCDDEGMPAYLENSKERNLGFYQGHGFEVMREIRFAKSAPPLWLMWRKPRDLNA
ncbi:MAG: GNAT family N-acetyltransferase [Halioglobus sp.]